jgi:hypothetical protein
MICPHQSVLNAKSVNAIIGNRFTKMMKVVIHLSADHAPIAYMKLIKNAESLNTITLIRKRNDQAKVQAGHLLQMREA